MSIQICGPTVGRLRQEDHQLESSLGFIDRASIRKREGQQRQEESAKRSGTFHGDRGSEKLHLNSNLRRRREMPRRKAGASTHQEVCLVSMKTSREASKAAAGQERGTAAPGPASAVKLEPQGFGKEKSG